MRKMWLNTTQIARERNVTSQTVRRWILKGLYERVQRTAGGHFRVWVERPLRTICYGRVSSAKQKGSIETQRRLLTKAWPDASFCSDIGSGFNTRRPKYHAILERALRGEPIRLVATTSDRISRSEFNLVRRIVEFSGGCVELLEEAPSANIFDVRYLIAYVTSFCNSVSGRRSHQRRATHSALSQGARVARAA